MLHLVPKQVSKQAHSLVILRSGTRFMVGSCIWLPFFELIKAKENPQEQGEKTCGLIFSDKEYFKCFTIEEKWALTVYRRTAALDYV
jgi:hypothetical protein